MTLAACRCSCPSCSSAGAGCGRGEGDDADGGGDTPSKVHPMNGRLHPPRPFRAHAWGPASAAPGGPSKTLRVKSHGGVPRPSRAHPAPARKPPAGPKRRASSTGEMIRGHNEFPRPCPAAGRLRCTENARLKSVDSLVKTFSLVFTRFRVSSLVSRFFHSFSPPFSRNIRPRAATACSARRAGTAPTPRDVRPQEIAKSPNPLDPAPSLGTM